MELLYAIWRHDSIPRNFLMGGGDLETDLSATVADLSPLPPNSSDCPRGQKVQSNHVELYFFPKYKLKITL